MSSRPPDGTPGSGGAGDAAASETLLVARVGKPHGLRGEVTVQVHTDVPHLRFVPGIVLLTEPAARGPLTVLAARRHGTVQLLSFEGVSDRAGAEGLRGTRLLLDLADDDPDDPDDLDEGWYADDLVGLDVLLRDGSDVGRVTALHLREAQDLLEVGFPDGGSALVPFVEEIVVEVEPGSGWIIIDPPPGLLELSTGAPEGHALTEDARD